MSERFVYVTYVRTTPEKLWAALTEPEFTRQYWAETHQESTWEKGAAWRLMIPDGRVGDQGTVVEIERPRRLVLSWQNEFMAELKAEGPTTCTWEMEATGEVVKLTLTHASEVRGSKVIAAVSNGWPMLLSSVKSLLETGKALPGGDKWPEGH